MLCRIILTFGFLLTLLGVEGQRTALQNHNWVLSRSLDASGMGKSVTIQYFDQAGRPSQTQILDKVSGKVFTSQQVNDGYGRPVLSTLSAPTGSMLGHKDSFVTTVSGAPYEYEYFDEAKSENPDPIGSQPGTLGWYYSVNNDQEERVPTSSYPYTRIDFYRDGTGSIKRTSGLGEAYKQGTGRELSSFTTAVQHELDHYLQIRNTYFEPAALGAMPTTLEGKAIQTIVRDVNGKEAVSIADKDGRVLMSAMVGDELAVTNHIIVDTSDQGFYYFKLLSNSEVTVSGSGYTLYDMSTEAPMTEFSGSATLSKGFYKLINNGLLPITLTYSNSYGDISYIYYNQVGQPVASIDPEGVRRLIETPNAYSTKADIPFISTSEYNLRGQLIAATGVDGGRAEFVYRNDGKLRFSQNAKQRSQGWFSYTNYDRWGRAIESGEYRPGLGDGISFEGLKANDAILETSAEDGGLPITSNKYNWTRSRYDVTDNSHGLTSYIQRFVRGGVSTTEGPSSKTWYSYDEQGRSTFTIKAIYGMSGSNPRYFTEDYEYDSEGNLIKSIFQKDIPTETFVHYFQYDANDRLTKVYTNTIDDTTTRTQQAKYEYFLHGPVKRLEIGGNLQGIDYTYTLDGKLKAINHSNKGMDPGMDGVAGSSNSDFLPDAFGEVLEYYEDDYISNTLIGSSTEGASGATVYEDLELSTYDQLITEYKATNSITFKDGFDSNGGEFSTQLGVPASGEGGDPSTPSRNISVEINDSSIPQQYGGQIRAMSWFSKKPIMAGVPETPNVYGYQYDTKYRFNTATWGSISNNVFVPQTGINAESVTSYDRHGNIQGLSRTDESGILLDNFSYQYVQSPKPSNKLQGIIQQTTGQAYANYEYDELGQLTAEIPGPAYGNAPAKYINYNVEGLVTGVFSDPDTIHPLVRYVYDELGARIKKISYNSTGTVIKTTYYLGGIVYEQQAGQSEALQTEVPIAAGDRIGIYFRQSNAYRYEITDHLGNVRSVFVKTSTDSIDYVVFRDYYPFGMEIGGRSYTDAEGYRYGYQGKYAEKDPETGWNAFELRMYDSRVGRWLSIDPAGEFFSPYVAMGNDPGNTLDPTGGYTDDPEPKWVTLENVTVVAYANKWNRMNQIDWNNLVDFKGGVSKGYDYYANILRNNHGSESAWKFLNSAFDPNNAKFRYEYNFGAGREAYEMWQKFWVIELGLSFVPFEKAGVFLYRGGKGLYLFVKGGKSSVQAIEVAAKGGGRVFWSGGDVAKNAAMDFAKANGMKTLEMTTGGRIMNTVGPYLPRSISTPIWDGLSRNFARGASGNINVFQNAAGVSLRSTWRRIEYPILKNNNIIFNIVK